MLYFKMGKPVPTRGGGTKWDIDEKYVVEATSIVQIYRDIKELISIINGGHVND
jgi:hypothetical protein